MNSNCSVTDIPENSIHASCDLPERNFAGLLIVQHSSYEDFVEDKINVAGTYRREMIRRSSRYTSGEKSCVYPTRSTFVNLFRYANLLEQSYVDISSHLSIIILPCLKNWNQIDCDLINIVISKFMSVSWDQFSIESF